MKSVLFVKDKQKCEYNTYFIWRAGCSVNVRSYSVLVLNFSVWLCSNLWPSCLKQTISPDSCAFIRRINLKSEAIIAYTRTWSCNVYSTAAGSCYQRFSIFTLWCNVWNVKSSAIMSFKIYNTLCFFKLFDHLIVSDISKFISLLYNIS